MTIERLKQSIQPGGTMFKLRVMLAAVLAVTLSVSAKAQPQADAVSKDAPATGANGESDRDLVLPDLLDNGNEPEDRLVILPEIKRDGERFYLSSFKLPDKLTFAGQPVPLDNWPRPACLTISSTCCSSKVSAFPLLTPEPRRQGPGSSFLPRVVAIV